MSDELTARLERLVQPMSCPNPPKGIEKARIEQKAREQAEVADSRIVFTDGLGGMGCGSWSDGPAAIRQAAFDSVYFAREDKAA